MTNTATRLAWRCAVAIIVVANSGFTSAAPVQWTVASGGNGHYYEAFNPGPITWDESRTAATNVHDGSGDLASITSAAENAFVFALVNDSAYFNVGRGPWLGGFQDPTGAEPSGGWMWVSGEPFSYTNWTPGEPNELHGGASDNLHLQNGSGPADSWNDEEGSSNGPIAYVAEFNANPVPEPSGLLLFTMANLFIVLFRSQPLQTSLSYC